MDDTVYANVAFGHVKDIDERWVERCVEIACLLALLVTFGATRYWRKCFDSICGRSRGYYTRALYTAKFAYSDKATSALDVKTERVLMESIIQHCKSNNIAAIIIVTETEPYVDACGLMRSCWHLLEMDWQV